MFCDVAHLCDFIVQLRRFRLIECDLKLFAALQCLHSMMLHGI